MNKVDTDIPKITA